MCIRDSIELWEFRYQRLLNEAVCILNSHSLVVIVVDMSIQCLKATARASIAVTLVHMGNKEAYKLLSDGLQIRERV